MTTDWERFKIAAQGGEPDRVPVALIVDSPWLPGYAGMDTRDFFLFDERWLAAHKGLLDRFPGAVWLPGFWVEYGMAGEPSAFGVKMRFHDDSPPSIEPIVTDLEFWAEHISAADPQTDGLMPLVLRQYRTLDDQLRAEGLGVKMVAARGPMAVASWLAGISPLMLDLAMEPERVTKILETVTTTIIRWLHAQLDAVHDPEGILVLDDIVGMVSAATYEEWVQPHLQRLFGEFEGLIRVYHNDTPVKHLLDVLPNAGFDVFNFSHELDIAQVKVRVNGRAALLGNVAPLDLGVRGTPEDVYTAAQACLDAAAPGGGMILSFGGGISPGTPPENIDALLQAARDWSPV
ncbi:MAG TPA: uroporphyrinogen decarboxylase family protein [Aggregatilinea sp.]|uniref:uroporphyrinogen decarboxylase family protein n=1 Tax=Aggregatilinea sp. TaxID=2806333 RepID=UPI002D0547AB|nr:uroporphyrinogen decarboxylase family protein [Aggregatilinea sp.]HML20553.1 uroporphyrinogen decarboxylase family protein [Aggregatilinea sp.]